MNRTILLVFMCLMCGTVMAQDPKVTPVMSKDLPDVAGKEVLMITVDYPPGGKIQSIDTTRMDSFTCLKVRS